MSKKDKRFEVIYRQGSVDIVEILVDKETGVQYLYRQSGYAGGLTPLLDSFGHVAVTARKATEEKQ